MASFTGAAKRLEVLAQGNGTIVYRDFAHAPSKVRATMEAVKAQYPDKKLYAYFGTPYLQQPQRSVHERV
jgi:UDP-N-acetylmuramate: L-alanyl-gamma-D-glutamyl-meso-diaminopimelate ligase